MPLTLAADQFGCFRALRAQANGQGGAAAEIAGEYFAPATPEPGGSFAQAAPGSAHSQHGQPSGRKGSAQSVQRPPVSNPMMDEVNELRRQYVESGGEDAQVRPTAEHLLCS